MTNAAFRLFVGIRLPDGVRRRLAAIQDALREPRARIGWVRPENLHVTIAFLGDVPADHIADWSRALDAAAGGVPGFDMGIERLGRFGTPGNPKVIWAGPGATPPGLAAVRANVAAVCRGFGIRVEDRPFSAHVTLGRVRSAAGAEAVVRRLEAFPLPLGIEPFRVRRIGLMRSDLLPGGPVYTRLHESPLRGVAAPG